MKLCSFLLGLLLLWSCSSLAKEKTIQVGYHRTIETIMILRALSPDDYFLKRVKDTSKGRPTIYLARRHFAKYKDHPAVAATQTIINTTADIGGILFQGVLYAEELPGTAMVHEPPPGFWTEHKAELTEYMKVLGDFYKEADAGSFFEKNKWFYDGAIAEAKQYITDTRVPVLEDYFGKSMEAYHLYILPLCPYGWGFSLTTPDKKYNVQHSIVAPVHNIAWNESVKQPVEFGFGGKGAKEHYRDIVAHEIIHSFITDAILTEPYKSRIDGYDSLFTPMFDSVMQELAYGHWWDFVNEHLVRLAHIRVLEIMNPQDAAELRKIDVYENKFVLIPDGEELMKQYERNRKTYKTIDTYLPVLIQQFGKYTRAEIDKKIVAASTASQ
jgi:hypothetical protein